MPIAFRDQDELREHAAKAEGLVDALSIEQQLQLAAANFGGTLESKLTAAAVATVMVRMMQLDEEDKRDLFACVMDMTSIKTRADAEETMKTILEILEPQLSSAILSSDVLDKAHPRHQHESWLIWISKKIRTLREERNLTQIELAKLAGLEQSHISRLEQGMHSPNSKTLKKLADALKVDVGTLTLLSAE